MSDEGGEEKVTRLLDMVVEEVSLVDRAANKHRFLIVKRDETMAKARGKAKEPKDEDETAADDEAEGGSAPPSGKKPKRPFPPNAKAPPKKPKGGEDDLDEEDDDEEEESPPPRGRRRGAKKEALDPMSALGLTLATHDKLASAVEEIEADEEVDDEAYAELARDLRKASGAIAKAAGVELEDGDGEEDDDEEESDENETPTPKPGDQANGVLTAVRDILSRLEGALAPPAGGATPAPAGAEITKALREIATAVGAIGSSVKAQNARLATLEKRTGLPNSQTPERTSRRCDVSWPLDINRPMDRGSVKKELSFHDDD